MPSGSYSTKDYAPLADEVNPPFGNVAPAPVSRNGTIVYSKRSSASVSGSEDGYSYRSADRKGKARAFDDDDGDIGSRSAHASGSWAGGNNAYAASHASYGSEDTYAGSGGYAGGGGGDSADASYPPLNETESEEKRIQANLAKFAARDTARRKAARLSKVSSSPSNSRPNSIVSSSSSHRSQPMSPMSPLSAISEAKRGSLLGRARSSRKGKERESRDVELDEEPLAAQTYTNPYEHGGSGSAPSMNGSSPFADPSDLPSPTASVHSPDATGYVGPGWRGGAAAVEAPPPRKERWWHSLCAWGTDLDGGDNNASGQAGRTNPME